MEKLRKLSGLIALMMLLSMFAFLPKLHAAEGEIKVKLVGQWVGESSKKIDTDKIYTSLDDKIGTPEINAGLLRGLAKQFIGWSDKEPVKNGELQEGARLFSTADTIKMVFPNGVPDDAKIYAVYYSVNNPPEDPFPQASFNLIALGGITNNLKDRINNNQVMINSDTLAEDFLKNTDNVSDIKENGTRKITDYYKAGDNKEVVLNSEFKMDNLVNMLAYRNHHGGNWEIRPILSADYNKRFNNKNFPITDGKDEGYTYVDLKMNFGKDEGLVLPEKMFLSFNRAMHGDHYMYLVLMKMEQKRH